MLMLRTAEGISLKELMGMTLEGKLCELNAYVGMLQEQGFAECSEDLLILTTEGLFRSNLIISGIWGFIDNS